MINFKKGILLNIFLVLISCSKNESPSSTSQTEIIKTESANIVLDATKRASQNAAEMFDLGSVSAGKVIKKVFSISNTTSTTLSLSFSDLQNQLLSNTRFSVNMVTATPCGSTLKVNKTCSFEVSLNYVIGEEYIPFTTNILANETNPEFGKILLSGTKAQDISSQVQLANVLSLSKISESITVKTGSSSTKRFYIGNIGVTPLKTLQPIAPANGIISLNSCANLASLKINGTCFFDVTYQFDETKPLINDQITFSSADPLVNTENVAISLTVVNQPTITPVTSAIISSIGSLANLTDSVSKMRIYMANNGGSAIDTSTIVIPDPFIIDSTSCSGLLKVNKTCFVDLKIDPSKTSNMISILSAGSIAGIPFNIQAGDKNQSQTSCISGYHVDTGLCVLDSSNISTLTYAIAHTDWSMFGTSMFSDGTENTDLDSLLNGGLAVQQNMQGFFVTDTGLKISPQGIVCEVDPSANDFGQLGDMYFKSNNTIVEFIPDTRFTVRSASCDTILGQYWPISFDGSVALLSDSTQTTITHIMLASGEIIPVTNSSPVSTVFNIGYISQDQSKIAFFSIYNAPVVFTSGGFFSDTIRNLQVIDLSTNIIQSYDVRDILNTQIVDDKNWIDFVYKGFTSNGELIMSGMTTDPNTGLYQMSQIIKIDLNGNASVAISDRGSIMYQYPNTTAAATTPFIPHYFTCNGDTVLNTYDANLNLVGNINLLVGCNYSFIHQNSENALLFQDQGFGSKILINNTIYPVAPISTDSYFINSTSDQFIIVDHGNGKILRIQSNGLINTLYQMPNYNISNNSIWAMKTANNKFLVFDFGGTTTFGLIAILNEDGSINENFTQKIAQGYSFSIFPGVIAGENAASGYSESALLMTDPAGNLYMVADDMLQQVLLPSSFIDESNNYEIRTSTYVDPIKGDFFAKLLNAIYYIW